MDTLFCQLIDDCVCKQILTHEWRAYTNVINPGDSRWVLCYGYKGVSMEFDRNYVCVIKYPCTISQQHCFIEVINQKNITNEVHYKSIIN